MKILASDFDKTLYVAEEDILNKNVEAINKFINYGNTFCIITGRNYSNIKLLLNKYNIRYTYLICQDGAKIFNNVDYCINTINLTEQKIKNVVEILKKYNCPYYLDDGYNKTNNMNDCVKVVGYDYSSKDIADRIIKELKQTNETYSYLSTTHININDILVRKNAALKILLEKEKLQEQNLYVIGDAENDYEMLSDFKGAIMKDHDDILNDLKKPEYNYLYEYIEELMKN